MTPEHWKSRLAGPARPDGVPAGPTLAGRQLGPYLVDRLLGAGGMGEVYGARDTRLNRDVAIKVLPVYVSHDPERRRRFEQEARAISQLNHPRICTVYDVGHDDGVEYLVMELIAGESLASRLRRGPLPFPEAIARGIDIAEALDAAHRAGLAHRDLKPGNVMLAKAGAKLLDFGLAKPLPSAAGAADATLSAATAPDVLLGTPQYMAPEQIERGVSDARTDIFALGLVLYEMTTGGRPFDGASLPALMGAILRDAPAPPSTVAPALPKAFDRIVLRCLAKDPGDRWQSAADVAAALRWLLDDTGHAEGTTRAAAARHRASVAVVLGCLAAGILLGGGVVWRMTRPAPRVDAGVSRSVVEVPAAWSRPGRRQLAVSPDGRWLVFTAGNQLFSKSMEDVDPVPIPGTHEDPTEPAFSPDGKWIAYFAGAQVSALTGDVKKIAASGGTPIVLCQTRGVFGLAWSGHHIIFSDGTRVFDVSDEGGTPTLLTTGTGNERFYGPQLLPDGDSLLVTVSRSTAWDDADIVVYSIKGGTKKTIVQGGTAARYLPSGHIVFARNSTLYAIPFDAQKVEATGNATPVLDGVAEPATGGPTGAAQFDVTGAGTLAYVPGVSSLLRTLIWVDRTGQETPLPAPPRAYANPRLSPDGTRVAVEIRDRDSDIWLWDFARETLTRLTTEPSNEAAPAWAPDGQSVIYASDRDHRFGLYRQRADPTAAAEPLSISDRLRAPTSMTPDLLLFDQVAGATSSAGDRAGQTVNAFNRDLMALPLDGHSPLRTLLQTPFNEANGVVSPDGRWLAYDSDVSKSDEVYVRPFPDVNAAPILVSHDGGVLPRWTQNGAELAYVVPGANRFMAARVESAAGLHIAAPRALFDKPNYHIARRNWWDVTPDGTRFLLTKPANPVESARIIVVQHWLEELMSKAPGPGR